MIKGDAIGVIELSSLHKGYEVQDEVLKSTRVTKLIGRSICSGKYLVVVGGEIADVEACLALASARADYALVAALLVSNVDPRLFPALAGAVALEDPAVDGLLVIETFSVAAAIRAADCAVKTADVVLLRVHAAMAVGGKGLVVLTGDMDALRSALGPAIERAKEDGSLAGYSLISRPHPGLLNELI